VERLVGTSDAGQTLIGNGMGSIRGAAGPDLILLGPGDSSAFGGAGDDRMEGGSGKNSLYGGPGSDRLFGGAGDDFLEGGHPFIDSPGDDYLEGGEGNDRLYGSKGNDVLLGGAGDDYLYDSLSGADEFDAGDGNDYLGLTRFTGSGAEPAPVTLRGGAGDDIAALVVATATHITLDMGEGRDEVEFYRFSGTPSSL
jgi:Ca2+-binding RTX toxin-like protein